MFNSINIIAYFRKNLKYQKHAQGLLQRVFHVYILIFYLFFIAAVDINFDNNISFSFFLGIKFNVNSLL